MLKCGRDEYLCYVDNCKYTYDKMSEKAEEWSNVSTNSGQPFMLCSSKAFFDAVFNVAFNKLDFNVIEKEVKWLIRENSMIDTNLVKY